MAELFERRQMNGATFDDVELNGAHFLHCELTGVRMRGVVLVDVDISGEVEGLVVNGVDVTSYVTAELDRRDPERALMRPDDADGFRTAYDVACRRWDGTVASARELDPALLHESVDGEWSFIETLRHLTFATESWIGRGVLGDPRPWHPWSLPWEQMPDTEGVPRDRDVRPSLDEVLAVRADRQQMVRRVLADLTDAGLEASTPVSGPGWPDRPHSVLTCLRVVLNEEWEHQQYAERDLAVLRARADTPTGGPPLSAGVPRDTVEA